MKHLLNRDDGAAASVPHLGVREHRKIDWTVFVSRRLCSDRYSAGIRAVIRIMLQKTASKNNYYKKI